METKKRLKFEGDPYSKITQAIGQFGRNETSTLTLGTIIDAPPEIKLEIDNDPNIYDKYDVYVAEHLTRHERVITVEYGFPRIWDKKTEIGDMQKVAASSRNNIGSAPSTPYENYVMENAMLRFEDVLKIGDRVLVECDDENMRYIILDRVVSYE